MSQLTATAGRSATASKSCSPAARVTKSLLGYGVLAGPTFIIVSVAQATTRAGFDITRDSWSILANGSLAWIQIANFIVSGLMSVAFAVGMRRALPAIRRPGSTSGRWAPVLAACYGTSVALCGIFRADPANGFPVGTPKNYHAVSWHGDLHLSIGGIGFLCLIASCLSLARVFAERGERGWARYSRASGIAFLAGFACIVSAASMSWATLAFVAAVVIVWGWMAVVSIRLYREVSAG